MAFLNKKCKKEKTKLVKGKKPYIKKICSISKIEVWLVDGEYVRRNICEDFVNFDHHYHMSIIPKNEFWIAKEAKHDETRYYIDRMLTEYRMMVSGASYEAANMKGEIFERGERSKSEIMKKLGRKRMHKKEMLAKVHKKVLKSYSDHGKNLKVWIVNGELVRDFFYIDFAGGGHDKVYHFIPEGEVWLDDDIAARERKFILIHELHERALMSRGKDYPHGHWKATQVEDYFRHHPRGIDKAIMKEIAKQTAGRR
jgi:hypothetical protein